MTDPIIQVVTTTADKQDAETLAQALLTKRLAACVQISGPIDSSYWWNGRIETGTEWTCLVKTLRSLYREVEQTLLDLHPYDQPEILAIAVSDVSEGYAQWLREQVQPEFPPEPTPARPTAMAHAGGAESHGRGKQHPQSKVRSAEETSASHVEAPAAATVTPADAAALVPAAGPAAASQSNVPQAAPFATGDTTIPGAISEQPADDSAANDQPSATESTGKSAKRAPRKKSPKPSV